MAGWNDWNTSDVVTATQFQDLLQDQVIMVFADATARDAAVSGADLVEGMVAYLSDTNGLTRYTGAAWTTVLSDNLGLLKYDEAVSTIAAAGATETIDLNNGLVHDITLDENVTFTFSNPVATGRASSFTLILRQDGAGTNTATWPGSVKWAGGSAPTITATASAVDVLTFMTVDGGTTWYGFVAGQAMA